ncbi:hypothetical protein R1flu_013296 [Riccia fluitans]|uniref:SHSP domain-containing protein n=1 Tax=Riccia fluitans TaxID=41844 RepID=A0ABD1YD57_9MARC
MSLVPRGFGGSIFDPLFVGNIFDPIETMSRTLFDQAFPTTTLDKDVAAVANTRIDWVETPDAHVFRADLPGMKKEEIKVQVSDDGVLSISGERQKEKKDEKDNYRREERLFGRFFRQFKLPANTKTQEIKAKVENGVLTVCVPKTEEAKQKPPQVRSVEISA